jgi:RNA polymerase sigma factor (sigma-70 family)
MPRSLNDIYVAQRRSLVWTVMKIVGSRQTAEDLAQESYVKVAKALGERQIEHIQAFLYQTARNLALDYRRSEQSKARIELHIPDDKMVREIPAQSVSPEAEIIDRERFRILEKALASLPERARQVMILSRLEGWSYSRIAEHLAVSQNTVYNDMKLAMAHCLDAVTRHDRD